MPYGFTSPGANAGDAILKFLMQREMQNRQAMLDQAAMREQDDMRRHREEQVKMQLGQQDLQRDQFAANEAERDRVAGRQSQQDELAMADRRDAKNRIGILQMATAGVRGGTASPHDARLMALGEGVETGDMTNPDDVRAGELEDYEAKRRLDAQYLRQPSAARGQDWVIRDGVPTPIPAGTAQAGDRPYDPVAARSAQPVNDEAMDTAREVSRIASSLGSHAGFGGTFGKWSAQVPDALASQDTVDSRILLKSLKGLLTIENMGKMKGVLSDSDMRILQQASTTLDAPMSEPAAKAELERLVQVMSKVSSGAPRAEQPAPSGGGGFRVIGVR